MRAALLTLGLLAGCAAPPDYNAAAQQALADGRASLAVVGAPAAPAPSAPREPARIRPPRIAGLPTPATDVEPRRETSRDPADAPNSAAALNGSGPERLIALLGEPALRRDEGTASIWLYTAAGCQLDVMFYPGADGPRIVHVQARAGGFAQRTEAACLRDLAAQARRRPAEPRQGRLPVAEPVG